MISRDFRLLRSTFVATQDEAAAKALERIEAALKHKHEALARAVLYIEDGKPIEALGIILKALGAGGVEEESAKR